MICQRKTDEHALLIPSDVGAGYLTAERDFKDFSKYSALPSFMKLSRIDNGSGIQSILHQNRACWHKSCRDKYNRTKLQRLRERLDLDTDGKSVAKRTRLSQEYSTDRITQNYCFFCAQPEATNKLRKSKHLAWKHKFGLQ